MAYFLISVSTKLHLDLCLKHALAGFPNSTNGLWTFTETLENDFISFLYGARVFNLYKVTKKEAIKNAESLPPWPPVTSKISGKAYYFPFRLKLNPVREFIEPMVRPEFNYVAENLLLRGGYKKTHFQADQTTFQSVSQMGTIYSKPVEHLIINDYDTFTPMLTWNRSLASPPETFYFQEVILQSMIRQWLSDHTNLQFMLNSMDLPHLQAQDFEVLGEKALPEGHIDILIKDRIPTGYSRKVIIEIKLGQAQLKHVLQLKNYIDEIGQECLVGTLIARGFPKKVQMEAENNRVECLTYSFGQVNMTRKYSFAELRSNLTISLPKEHKL